MSRYLTTYNTLTSILWFSGLTLLIASVFFSSLSGYVNKYFIATQSLMLLDVVHVLLKLVSGRIITTVLQIVSRIYISWVILPAQDSLTVWNYVMFTAWSLAEIIRFQYYMRRDNKTMLFLRYNAFIILYPMGFLTGEVPLLWKYYKAQGNGFDLFMIASYIPFWPYLYWYMFSLRKAKVKDAAALQKTD
jgi:very-long-chain (3R)-3-hydroxyacyl-CoA dehydratase